MKASKWSIKCSKIVSCFIIMMMTIHLLNSCSSNKSKDETQLYQIPISILQDVNQFLSLDTTFNSDTYFLIDFNIASGKNRFFVYSASQDSIIDQGLVTRGSCKGKTALTGQKYSNTEGSYCTSLGKYKIGNSYQGDFGLAYKLYGMDDSNSNAFDRFIVLHSHGCVPDQEVPIPICLSQGCPTVSPNFLNRLALIIDSSQKPILLYLFDSSST